MEEGRCGFYSIFIHTLYIKGRIFGACRNTPKGACPLPHGSFFLHADKVATLKIARKVYSKLFNGPADF